MQPSHTNVIPTILEDMREQLCLYDIQSRNIHEYFARYLHEKTEHFVHEFYNFAISPYDIVGYDRNVDYRSRDQPSEVTVEISSNESSDGEVQVIDEGSAGSSSTVIQISPEATTQVVLETTGAQEESCRINDLQVEISENVPPASSEVVVESSDSECQFVLALKPPHLRTPEQVSLDSASDSDVVYIPNDHQRTSSDSDDTEDNKPLSETRKLLKSELCEEKYEIRQNYKTDEHIPEPNMKIDHSINLFNFGASTSAASQPDESVSNQKNLKIYYQPKRKSRCASKSIFEQSSSSSSSSSSSESSTSDDEWQTKQAISVGSKHKSSRHRRKGSKKMKRRVSSTIVSNPKPLCELQSSEEVREDEDTVMGTEHPRIKSVIIKKQDDQHHYIENANSNSNSNSELSISGD
jgi:E3 ubiquitin-protein ligase Topors